MVAKKPPQEPINTITNECDIIIFGIRRTVLKISPHFLKRNDEFRTSKKKRIKENLNRYLLDERVIKNFVWQLHEEEPLFEGINSDWPAWKYYAYEPIIDRRNDLVYRIVFFLDDNVSEIIGIITVYPRE